MQKTTAIFLILAIVPTIHAMDTMEIIKIVGTDEPKECYLAQLPTDALNHLAHYLDFYVESDAEAIERTTPMTDELKLSHQGITQEHWAQFATLSWPLSGITRGSYSSDRSKIVFMRKHHWQESASLFAQKPKVAILDISKNTVTLNEKLAALAAMDGECVSCIALSPNGTLFAELQSQVDDTSTGIGVMRYKNVLVIKNSITNGMQEFEIPGYHSPIVAMGFNKQDTKVIVHELNSHHIVSLTTPEEHEAKSKKTFSDYCKQHLICKNIMYREH
jgi:hypothetical protein